MTYDYVTVYGDDWTGLYLNGKLIKEDHSFDPDTVFSVILENGGIVSAHRVICADAQWLCDRGNLPEDLADVFIEEEE